MHTLYANPSRLPPYRTAAPWLQEVQMRIADLVLVHSLPAIGQSVDPSIAVQAPDRNSRTFCNFLVLLIRSSSLSRVIGILGSAAATLGSLLARCCCRFCESFFPSSLEHLKAPISQCFEAHGCDPVVKPASVVLAASALMAC